MGADWANGLKEANATMSHLASQLRGPLHRINHQLSDGRPFVLGQEPAAIDAQLYHLFWFVRGRWSNGPNFMSEFTFIEEWVKNISQLGHGDMHTLSAEEAIQIAKTVNQHVHRLLIQKIRKVSKKVCVYKYRPM